jgi:hypothetical protein
MGGAPLHSTSRHTSPAAGGEDERGGEVARGEARHSTAQLAPAALQGARARERLVRVIDGFGGEIYTTR